jgi:hypothetical protein
LIFAVTGRTAGELVLERSDVDRPTMGLSIWTGDRPRKADVGLAKNFLTEREDSELNRLTTMFLDFAEGCAERRHQTFMADWVVKTDRFVGFNERAVLSGPGSTITAALSRGNARPGWMGCARGGSRSGVARSGVAREVGVSDRVVRTPCVPGAYNSSVYMTSVAAAAVPAVPEHAATACARQPVDRAAAHPQLGDSESRARASCIIRACGGAPCR